MRYHELKNSLPFLYSNIEEFYPIENKNHQMDINSCNFKNLMDLIDLKITNKKNFKNYWINGILDQIQREIDGQVFDLTFGKIPNYGGMIRISDKIDERKSAVVEIQFYVSLIKNYFSIQIARIEELMEFSKALQQELIHQKLISLIISPSNDEYNSLFVKIESVLKNTLESPIFLPHSLDTTVLDELVVPHTFKEYNNIGDTFFCKILPPNISYTLIGNINYGIESIG